MKPVLKAQEEILKINTLKLTPVEYIHKLVVILDELDEESYSRGYNNGENDGYYSGYDSANYDHRND